MKNNPAPVSLTNKIDELYSACGRYPLKAKFPDNIMIELTNACNLKCRMCYNKDMRRKKGFMTFKLFKKVIDQARGLNIRNAGLYTIGESFLHPGIFDFISYAKKRGMQYVYITTNGQVFNDAMIGKIFDSGLDSIKFSIDAGRKSSYESTRKGAKWERLVDTIKKIRAIRDRRGSALRIFASYVVMKNNFKEIVDFNETFKGLIDETRYAFVFNLGGNVDTSSMYSVALREAWHPCALLWNRFIVTYDGKLTICCMDFESRLVYGDLKTDTLKGSWNNEVMTGFRQIHKDMEFDKLPICLRCDEIKMSADRDRLLSSLVTDMLKKGSLSKRALCAGKIFERPRSC